MPSDRPPLSGRVDEDTRDRWRAFARFHGLDISSLLEAMGRNLPAPDERLPTWLRQVVAQAREIRFERKDRQPPD